MGLHSTRWKHAVSEASRFTEQYSAPPIPVVEIAEGNGVDVVFADFGTHSETVAGFCDFRASKLFVNRADKLERQLFTIAHEFGHWVLHREFFLANPDKYPVFPRFQSGASKNSYEQEANKFAANLLVPDRLLRPVSSAPVSVLANIFKVSKTMMEFRLQDGR